MAQSLLVLRAYVSDQVDERIVAANNVAITDRMRSGEFLADLYYRLSGVTELPPLRACAGLRHRKSVRELLIVVPCHPFPILAKRG